MGDSDSGHTRQPGSDPAQEYQPEVLPSLLVDVTPNPFDIEGDTLLPYFMRLKELHEKRRAEKIAKTHEREQRIAERIGGTSVSLTGPRPK
jgi:hypothetical protein